MHAIGDIVVCVSMPVTLLNVHTPESETPKAEFRIATQEDTHASLVSAGERVRTAPLLDP